MMRHEFGEEEKKGERKRELQAHLDFEFGPETRYIDRRLHDENIVIGGICGTLEIAIFIGWRRERGRLGCQPISYFHRRPHANVSEFSRR